MIFEKPEKTEGTGLGELRAAFIRDLNEAIKKSPFNVGAKVDNKLKERILSDFKKAKKSGFV